MLTHSPLIAFIPTKDTTRARRFYEKILGLRFISDDSFAIVMDANGTMVRIVRVEDFTPFPFTDDRQGCRVHTLPLLRAKPRWCLDRPGRR